MSQTNDAHELLVSDNTGEHTPRTPQPETSRVGQCDTVPVQTNAAEIRTLTVPVEVHDTSDPAETHSEDNFGNQSNSTVDVESMEMTETPRFDQRLPVRESLGLFGCLVIISGSVISILVV